MGLEDREICTDGLGVQLRDHWGKRGLYAFIWTVSKGQPCSIDFGVLLGQRVLRGYARQTDRQTYTLSDMHAHILTLILKERDSDTLVTIYVDSRRSVSNTYIHYTSYGNTGQQV